MAGVLNFYYFLLKLSVRLRGECMCCVMKLSVCCAGKVKVVVIFYLGLQ